MSLEIRTENGKYKLRIDNAKLRDGEHEATIVKYRKALTFYNGVAPIPWVYGKIKFKIKDNMIHVYAVEFNSEKEHEKFIEEGKEIFEKFFEKIKEENSLMSLKIEENLI